MVTGAYQGQKSSQCKQEDFSGRCQTGGPVDGGDFTWCLLRTVDSDYERSVSGLWKSQMTPKSFVTITIPVF